MDISTSGPSSSPETIDLVSLPDESREGECDLGLIEPFPTPSPENMDNGAGKNCGHSDDGSKNSEVDGTVDEESHSNVSEMRGRGREVAQGVIHHSRRSSSAPARLPHATRNEADEWGQVRDVVRNAITRFPEFGYRLVRLIGLIQRKQEQTRRIGEVDEDLQRRLIERLIEELQTLLQAHALEPAAFITEGINLRFEGQAEVAPDQVIRTLQLRILEGSTNVAVTGNMESGRFELRMDGQVLITLLAGVNGQYSISCTTCGDRVTHIPALERVKLQGFNAEQDQNTDTHDDQDCSTPAPLELALLQETPKGKTNVLKDMIEELGLEGQRANGGVEDCQDRVTTSSLGQSVLQGAIDGGRVTASAERERPERVEIPANGDLEFEHGGTRNGDSSVSNGNRGQCEEAGRFKVGPKSSHDKDIASNPASSSSGQSWKDGQNRSQGLQARHQLRGLAIRRAVASGGPVEGTVTKVPRRETAAMYGHQFSNVTARERISKFVGVGGGLQKRESGQWSRESESGQGVPPLGSFPGAYIPVAPVYWHWSYRSNLTSFTSEGFDVAALSNRICALVEPVGLNWAQDVRAAVDSVTSNITILRALAGVHNEFQDILPASGMPVYMSAHRLWQGEKWSLRGVPGAGKIRALLLSDSGCALTQFADPKNAIFGKFSGPLIIDIPYFQLDVRTMLDDLAGIEFYQVTISGASAQFGRTIEIPELLRVMSATFGFKESERFDVTYLFLGTNDIKASLNSQGAETVAEVMAGIEAYGEELIGLVTDACVILGGGCVGGQLELQEDFQNLPLNGYMDPQGLNRGLNALQALFEQKRKSGVFSTAERGQVQIVPYFLPSTRQAGNGHCQPRMAYDFALRVANAMRLGLGKLGYNVDCGLNLEKAGGPPRWVYQEGTLTRVYNRAQRIPFPHPLPGSGRDLLQVQQIVPILVEPSRHFKFERIQFSPTREGRRLTELDFVTQAVIIWNQGHMFNSQLCSIQSSTPTLSTFVRFYENPYGRDGMIVAVGNELHFAPLGIAYTLKKRDII